MMRGVNGRTDRLISKIFLPGFWIQSEILTDFRILQFQRIADSSIPYARILDLECNWNIFARMSPLDDDDDDDIQPEGELEGEGLGWSREVWLVVSNHRDLKNLTLFMKGDPILWPLSSCPYSFRIEQN